MIWSPLSSAEPWAFCTNTQLDHLILAVSPTDSEPRMEEEQELLRPPIVGAASGAGVP